MRLERLPSCLISLVCLVIGVAYGGIAPAQDIGAPITQEYFIEQAADEALLIRIDAFEAEVESVVKGMEGQDLLFSGIADSRVAPVFQYVTPPVSQRQLGIEVSAASYTSRSEFELQLTRLAVWDERSDTVSQAYQMLSFGMQTPASDSEANWTVRINSLSNAAQVFQHYGMNEMRLWSMYLAAHLVQHQLHDYSYSYRMSREILRELNVARLPDIELAAWQLHSAALIGLKQTGSLPVTAQNPEPVQRALAQTARLAASIGALRAQAQALDDSGSEYAADGRFGDALERFERAVEIADSVGDAELSRHSRESMVEIHGKQGDAPASSKVLQQIETQLAGQGAGDDLALNLLSQGRLFISNYRYAQARSVLTQALAHQNYSAIRIQLEFELARIAYQAGRLDDALALLQDAGIGPHQQKRPNSIIDNGLAMSLLANIQRARGATAQMREARRAQGLYEDETGHYLYQQGLDELVTGTAGQDRARVFFRRSYTAARSTGNHDLGDLALMQYCSLGGGAECYRENVDSSYRRLVASGVPRNGVQAMYLHARILARQGRYAEALSSLRSLVEEMHFLRHSLPGVLGAWYFDHHRSAFDFYISLLVNERGTHAAASATDSLLALSRVRLIDRYDPVAPGEDPTEVDVQSLRALLAERAQASSGGTPVGTVERITSGLATLRSVFRTRFSYLSEQGVRSYLRQLSRDDIVLTYHISEQTAQVWVGNRDGVARYPIRGASSAYRLIQQAHDRLPGTRETVFVETMERLGERLLEPIKGALGHTIYWIPAGPLLGLPLDAMRLDGHFLAEKHHVINLLSFPTERELFTDARVEAIGDVFLAGDPQDYSADYATSFETTEELRTLMDVFVGPGLHVVQGSALLADEFEDPRFEQASLVHLAMPGVIDLRDSARSNLELSGSETIPGRNRYGPDSVRSLSMQATLVFLSSTRTTAHPQSAYSTTPGLVFDFTNAGARAVIADLWASAGRADESFLTDFYQELRDSGDIPTALQNAKQQYLQNNRGKGLYGWAGYQLFMP